MTKLEEIRSSIVTICKQLGMAEAAAKGVAERVIGNFPPDPEDILGLTNSMFKGLEKFSLEHLPEATMIKLQITLNQISNINKTINEVEDD